MKNKSGKQLVNEMVQLAIQELQERGLPTDAVYAQLSGRMHTVMACMVDKHPDLENELQWLVNND